MAPSLGFDAIEAARRNWVEHNLPEPDAMAAATSIMRAEQIVSAAVEQALRPLGLTFARWELLMLLTFSKGGSLPMTKIGERLMVHPTGISKLVDKLEEQRLVRRDAHPTDRRTTLATILPDGRKLARRGAKVVGQVRFGMDIPVTELHELTAVITSLRLHVGDFPSEEQ
jgi:DNA-binding MarR family transcriptional regulator